MNYKKISKEYLELNYEVLGSSGSNNTRQHLIPVGTLLIIHATLTTSLLVILISLPL